MMRSRGMQVCKRMEERGRGYWSDEMASREKMWELEMGEGVWSCVVLCAGARAAIGISGREKELSRAQTLSGLWRCRNSTHTRRVQNCQSARYKGWINLLQYGDGLRATAYRPTQTVFISTAMRLGPPPRTGKGFDSLKDQRGSPLAHSQVKRSLKGFFLRTDTLRIRYSCKSTLPRYA